MRVERMKRWRPGWDVDVVIDGTVLALHARGERELNFAIPCRIADEVRVHHLLEANGLPVPHAYGLCDDPYSLVMDRLPGAVDLTFAASDYERTQLIEEYLSMLPRIYGTSDATSFVPVSTSRRAPKESRLIRSGASSGFTTT